VVTTRIQTSRRRLRTGGHAEPVRPGGTAWPFLAAIAGSATAGRLGLPSLGRAYAAAAGLLVVVIAYLVVGTQATQTSYELDRLKDEHAQLLAEQDQLRYQDARMHTQAGVAQSAAAAGLQHGNVPRYAGYQPVALDLRAPIGPGRAEDTPLWQRALAAIVGGPVREALAAGS
jgi:hypothetical protein